MVLCITYVYHGHCSLGLGHISLEWLWYTITLRKQIIISSKVVLSLLQILIKEYSRAEGSDKSKLVVQSRKRENPLLLQIKSLNLSLKNIEVTIVVIQKT